MKRKLVGKRIFLDHASTTPIDPRVLKKLIPFLTHTFANPSALYEEGVFAQKIIEEARKKVAFILQAHADEIVFTGTGTESDNLAIFGTFASALSLGVKKPHIITSAFEHPAVLEAIRECEKRGASVTCLIPSKEGFIQPDDVRKALKKNTILVSCMYANNEIGTIQPIREIAKAIRFFKKQHKVASNFPYFHVDASQAVNYLPLSVENLHADLLTLDGSKIYGPKGVGVLFVRRGVNISPRILGGGQEGGRRSGTENLPLISAFAEALSIAQQEALKESKRLAPLRDSLAKKILDLYPKAHINGSLQNRLPNNVNICFPGQDGELLVLRLDAKGVSVSSSSSCRTLSQNARSYVVDLLGDPHCGESSLRFTLGRGTVSKDINLVVSILKKIIY